MDTRTMRGLSPMQDAAKVASTIRIAECKPVRSMFAQNADIHTTFGQSSTAGVAEAENMK